MKKFLYFFSILYILGNCFVEKRSRQHAKTSGSLRGPVRDGRRVGTCRQRLGHRVLTAGERIQNFFFVSASFSASYERFFSLEAEFHQTTKEFSDFFSLALLTMAPNERNLSLGDSNANASKRSRVGCFARWRACYLEHAVRMDRFPVRARRDIL